MKVLAINKNGELSYCSVAPAERGKGRCPHIGHQEEGESTADFIERVNAQIKINGVEEESMPEIAPEEKIDQEEIDELAAQIDSIAGVKVTAENLNEVLDSLTPEQIRKITEIGFNSAPEFDLPISDEEYFDRDAENKLYFANLPEWGIGGKITSIKQMFEEVGEVPSEEGSTFIKGNYKEGLTPSEYFEKQFSARSAAIAKTVSVSEPGYMARKLFYGLSDIEVKSDCHNEGSSGIMECSVPGGFCSKCAAKDGLDVEPGTLFGSIVSTNLSEPLTQLTMKQFHTGGKGLIDTGEEKNVISRTFDAVKSSKIINQAVNAETTEEMRDIIYQGLKEEYAKEKISMDDYNIKVIAKKMTSYKRDPKEGTRFVRDGERCDIISIGAIGNNSNPFKASELQSAYKRLTQTGEFEVKPDAANEIIF